MNMFKENDSIKILDDLVEKMVKMGMNENTAKNVGKKLVGTEHVVIGVRIVRNIEYVTIPSGIEIPAVCCEIIEPDKQQ